MDWDSAAHAAIRKVPFFVRSRVKKKVEAHVKDLGLTLVTLDHVNDLRKKFLSKGGMEKELKGYDISTCFSGGGCPNVAHPATDLLVDIELLMARAKMFEFLKSRVKGDLKFHHEFRISISDCPNACSRPQIADIGIIGACRPRVGEGCTLCMACVRSCPDKAIQLWEGDERPIIDMEACKDCGQCIKVCPARSLEKDKTGFKVLLGGRLGRNPRLGMPVPGILSHQETMALVEKCLAYYKTHSLNGERFSHLIESVDQVLSFDG